MLFLLDRNVRTVKWNGIPLHEASSAVVREETNGDFSLSVRYPITDSGIYQLIQEDMLIKAPVPVLGPQLFRIKKPVENDDSLDITAYHITDDIMKRSVNPLSVVGQGCATALSQMVQQVKTELGQFSFISNITEKRTFNTTEVETLYSVLLDGAHSIVGTWEGELVRDNFAMTIKKSRGIDRGVVITTHKNLKSYQRTKNSQGVVTRIHVTSTFKEEGAEEEITLRLTVDSPLINAYPYINEKEFENNNLKTIDDLRKWAEAKFKNEGIDKVSDAIEIEAYELDGQVVHLGDTVNLKSRKHNVDVYKKAIAYEFNCLANDGKGEYISITFDDKPGVGGSGVSSGLSNAADAILGAGASAQEVAIERAIRNANQAFDAEFDKRVEAINDSIEQTKADAEVYADQIHQDIDQEFSSFEQGFEAYQQSQERRIAEILAKAQSIEGLANQSKADAASALARANQAKSEAIAEANRLLTVERQATDGKLATAKSQAVSEANQLIETAKSLLAGQINGVSTDLTSTKEAIKLLATRQTVDALTGRVSNAESNLQLQAGQIASRVKVSDFDQAKQRLQSAETLITQLGNRITTEISETVAKIPTEVGGRNYFTLTNVPANTTGASIKRITVNLMPNTLYMVSTDIPKPGNYFDAFAHLPEEQANSNINGIDPTVGRIVSTGNDGKLVLSLRTQNDLDKVLRGEYHIKIETGRIKTDWSPAPEDTQSQLDEQAQSLSQVIQTAQGLVSEVTGANGLKSQVSQLNDSYAIKFLNSAGNLISQANLAGPEFLLEAAKIRLKGKTLADEIQAIDGKFNNLFVGDGTFGKLNSNIITTQSITGDKIKFDQSFFNYLMANEAYLKQLFAKNAFITQVQSVDISADRISGGVIEAINKALEINLNMGMIDFLSNNAAIRRKVAGYPNQYVKFISTTSSGAPSSSTVIGSNRDGSEIHDNDTFAGIRIHNGQNIEFTQFISDNMEFVTGLSNRRGWAMNTVAGSDKRQINIYPIGNPTRSNITASHYIIRHNNRDVELNAIIHSLKQCIAAFRNINGDVNMRRVVDAALNGTLEGF